LCFKVNANMSNKQMNFEKVLFTTRQRKAPFPFCEIGLPYSFTSATNINLLRLVAAADANMCFMYYSVLYLCQ